MLLQIQLIKKKLGHLVNPWRPSSVFAKEYYRPTCCPGKLTDLKTTCSRLLHHAQQSWLSHTQFGLSALVVFFMKSIKSISSFFWNFVAIDAVNNMVMGWFRTKAPWKTWFFFGQKKFFGILVIKNIFLTKFWLFLTTVRIF